MDPAAQGAGDLRRRLPARADRRCSPSASCSAASSTATARTASARSASLQPMADIGKLLFKEQFRPRTSIGWLFALAPAISMMTAVATIAIIPFSDTVDIFGTAGRALRHRPEHRDPLRVRVRRHRVLRADARRLGVGLEVLVPRLDARRRAADLLRGRAGPRARRRGDDGRLAVADRDRRVRRRTHLWFIIPQFVGFLIFLVAGFAETNRAAVRPRRGRRRARRRLQHRVRRRPLRRVLRGRVPEHGRRLGAHRDAVPRRLGHPVLATRRRGSTRSSCS